jgi:hypothetical protein
MMERFLICLLLFWLNPSRSTANSGPQTDDFCKRLEQSIQGKKHGFLAGNLAYYVGGFHASWEANRG